ncbi:MAG: DUF4249 domain-containing protein [Bacteroidales bacterium]|nr:DUF4249 domain-containing protein [Bacteroidales bacterium]
MRKDKHLLILGTGILFLLATSCESVLFIELEESDKLIVLNGTLSKDSTVVVQVSRTRHILDNADLEPLENASVNLFRGGERIMQMDYSGNAYFLASGFRPAIGEELSIEVEQAGYPTVSARCEIPETVGIQSVDTSTVVQEYGDMYYSYTEEMFQMDVTLRDPPGVDNYYLLNLLVDKSYTSWRDTTVQYVDSLYHNSEWQYYVADSTYTLTEIFRYAEDPMVSSPDLVVEANTPEGILFSDQLIDGKEYSLRVSTMGYALGSADSAVVDIRLHSISESYYKYLKTRQKHYETKEDPFAVPVIVYTNVEGGAGFLGGYSSDVHSITTFVPEFGNEYWYYEYE